VGEAILMTEIAWCVAEVGATTAAITALVATAVAPGVFRHRNGGGGERSTFLLFATLLTTEALHIFISYV
jgi:hypothetical protein